MKKLKKILVSVVAAVFMAAALSMTALATGSGDVAGAVESTWSTAQSQIKTVVNNVVFPVIDVILAILFFVKIGTAYFDCAPVRAM